MAVENYRGFKFRFVNDVHYQGKIRVYVEQYPSYRDRDTDSHSTHLWPANKDGINHPPYICVKPEYMPETYSEAVELARDWADRTLVYISTGQTISEQIAAGR